MDYMTYEEIAPYDLNQRLSNMLEEVFPDELDAKIDLAKFILMADALGHRGQYDLRVDGNKIVQN